MNASAIRQYFRSHYHVYLWSFIGGSVLPFILCRKCSESLDVYLNVAACNITIWLAMWIGNDVISHSLDKLIPWTTQTFRRLIIGVIAMGVYSVGTVYLILKIFEWTLGFYYGDTSTILYWTLILTSVITLILTSRSFLLNWRQSAIDAERAQKESIASRYESLKSQINPHFLFNTLNVLTNVVYEDQDKAAKFIKQLSEVYRHVLDTRDRELVTLAEEKKFLDSYLYLQQIRFGPKLIFDMDIDHVVCQVPPLVLQMLIENAIKHNIVSEEDPLTIRMYASADYIVVENDLQKKTVLPEESAGVGLENICRRYEFLTSKPVIIEQGEKFIVKLPMIR